MNGSDGVLAQWFIPLAICFWWTLLALLSLNSGWLALARNYRRRQPLRESRLFIFQSVGLGSGWFPVSYGGCVFVRVAPAGLGLAVFPLFRFFHPPLTIPWHAIRECRRRRFWFFTWVVAYLAESSTRLLFNGRLGQYVLDSFTDQTRRG